ncbi:hypothetical protein [Pseudonocardia humida]|uniref:DUF1707 domain-containing protein n=1 Tax=Pseudonocardia humida TaxID=2800819 RepID=A0ABT0ZYS5_9PSEU|nr:hypothetical protein [Pseudonocardia humida]MCO1655759.1 hypothetical protein [Pseudonocardia humida]
MPNSPARGANRGPAAEEPHPVLRYLTDGGRQEWQNALARYDRELAGELGRRAAPVLDSGRTPELTSADVSAAVAAFEDRLRAEPPAAEEPGSRSSLWAAITLTLASVGIGVMPNFLGDQPWQYVLFVVLIIVGVVGLVLTWVAGTSGRRRATRGGTQGPPGPSGHNT